MLETTQNPTQPNYKRRQAVAAGALAIGVGLAGLATAEGVSAAKTAVDNHAEHSDLVDNLQRPDALAEYRKGDGIPHDKAVVLQAPKSMTPFDFAEEINAEGVDLRDITAQITPQADAQLDPGLQPHEQVVVEKELVSEDAVDKFGVPDINSPEYVSISPPEDK